MDFTVLLSLLAGLALLIVGAEILIRGATRLALFAGISPLVVGLTVVAYGTSAPEAAVNPPAPACRGVLRNDKLLTLSFPNPRILDFPKRFGYIHIIDVPLQTPGVR